MKLGPAKLADGTIVKRINVYDVHVGDDKFVVFASSEVAAARVVVGHLGLEALPERFDVSFVRPAKDLLFTGSFNDLLTSEAYVKELENLVTDFTARAVVAESYVEGYRAKLQAAILLVKEVREMHALIKAMVGPASGELSQALDHYDAVPLPDDLRRK